jgi:hypothetical protein
MILTADSIGSVRESRGLFRRPALRKWWRWLPWGAGRLLALPARPSPERSSRRAAANSVSLALLLRSPPGPIHSTVPMLFRAALFASLVLALCVAGRSAFAMPAGVCDDRGATAIAPAPSLEAPDVAIRRARAVGSCGERELLARTRIAPARRVFAPPSAATCGALSVVTYPVAGDGERLERFSRVSRPPWGVRWRVERPPRV